MSGITVRELAKACQDMIKRGYGDRTVLIPSDDEGNEYHTLWYSFITNEEEIKMCSEYGMFHDNNDPSEVVLLG